MGCRQAVRHQTLTLAFVGSNPAIPARKSTQPFGPCAFSRLRFHDLEPLKCEAFDRFSLRRTLSRSPFTRKPGSKIRPSQPTQKARYGVPFVLAERCVPLARNVMCPSGVMFASQVMRASRVGMQNTSHHFAPKAQYITVRKHYITAATPQHHFFIPHTTKTTDRFEPPHRRGRPPGRPEQIRTNGSPRTSTPTIQKLFTKT